MADNGYKNKTVYISGMLSNMLRIVYHQPVVIEPETYFKDDLELILDLSKRKVRDVTDLTKNLDLGIDEGWRQCDYILYALFFGLREKVPLKMLEKVPGEEIVKLKDAIDKAKDRGGPTAEDVEVAEKLGNRFANMAKNQKFNDFKKAQINIVRFSAFITKAIAVNWVAVDEQMSRWSDAVDERVAVDGLDKLRSVRSPILPLNQKPHEKPVAPKKPEEKKEVRQVAEPKEKAQVVVGDAQIGVAAPVVTVEATIPVVQTTQEKEVKPVVEPKAQVVVGGAQNGGASPVVKDVEKKKDVAGKTPESDKEERWTIKELAAKLGYKNITSIHIKQTMYLTQHPDDNEAQKFFQKCFVYTYDGRKRKWFVAKYFEELKKYIPLMGETGKYPEVMTDEKGRVLWKTDEVASELGFNSTEYFLKKRKDLMKKNSAVGTWFKEIGPVLYFYSEHLDEMRILLQPITNTREDVIKDKDGNELWSIKKLVAELGLPNEMCFFNRKSRLVKRFPNAENYFVKIGNTKYFKAVGENLNELKALLKKMGERSDKQKGEKSDKPAKKSVKAGASEEQPIVVVSAESVADEHPTVEREEQIVFDQPTDLVGVKALDTMLAELQKRYTAALEDQKKKEKKFTRLFNAAEKAEQELGTANERVEDLKTNIEKAKGLFRAYNEINQFLVGTTQVLEK